MPATRNLCAQLPLDLHQRVCEAREESGLTTAQYITNLLLEYYEMKENGGNEAMTNNQLKSAKKEGCGMMSPSDEKRIIAMVDSFTKTVARNFSRNLKRAKANAEKHYSDEPVDYFLETLSHDDRYPSDYFVLYADELSCVVYSETLYKALRSLPDKQRKVLLFDFWGALPDGEIAKRMEETTRSVYNLRQRAFQAIRTFYEQESSEP